MLSSGIIIFVQTRFTFSYFIIHEKEKAGDAAALSDAAFLFSSPSRKLLLYTLQKMTRK
jgi:CRISPR/Cas system endoribonuclease Cas6 (RAMP superfamily)